MIPLPSLDIGRIPTSADIRSIAGTLAEAAGRVHGEWNQDADGFDEVLGSGGICQDIAYAMVSVLAENGFEHAMTCHGTVGENHVWVIALCEDGVYSVDIPPSVYEIGSGYVWRKRHDAHITADDVAIYRIGDPMTPDAFEEAFGDW